MVRVVGVRFKRAGKVYYFDPAEHPLSPGAKVVVETARGIEYGEVAVGPKDVPEEQVVQPLKRVIRPGTEKDAVIAAENKRKEKEAFGIALKKIQSHGLEMTLVDVEYTFDGSKIIFYFTADGRIDFRELVRDLAGTFRTRIEMRQIGVRDEAKLLGGIGPCGRVLCCTSFLGDFAPVSIRMAKDQNLSLNPSKISGLCGRLMCCLRFEQETYEAAKKDPTLAPGYVPPEGQEPQLEPDFPEIDEPEETPVPAIGLPERRGSGISARIAQAAGLVEKRQQDDEREGERDRPRSRRSRRRKGGARQQAQSRQKAPQGAVAVQPEKPQGEHEGTPRRKRSAKQALSAPRQKGSGRKSKVESQQASMREVRPQEERAQGAREQSKRRRRRRRSKKPKTNSGSDA